MNCPICGQALQAIGKYDICPEHGPVERGKIDTHVPGERSTLPSVLAIPLREYSIEADPVLKLWHACDVVELSLRLAVSLGVAELVRFGGLSDQTLAEFKPRIEEPTLGKWRGMAEAVAQVPPQQGAIFPELRRLIQDTLVPLLDGPTKARTPETSFSALRNRLAHGGGITRAAAARLAGMWGPRFEEAVKGIAWLSDLDFVVRHGEGIAMLRGTATSPVRYEPKNDTTRVRIISSFVRGDEIVVVRGDHVLPLWPLTLYGVSVGPDPDAAPGQLETAQVFARRGEFRLQYTPVGSEDVCLGEGDDGGLDAFLSLFRLRSEDRSEIRKSFAVRDFESDIRRDADKLVGRSGELEQVRRILGSTSDSVLWLTGPAGIGKSYLLARITADLLDEPSAYTLILPYRFKAGDDRCSRRDFFAFALERLQVCETLPKLAAVDDENKTLQERLEMRLNHLGDCSVLFVLDGLDEVAERDSGFAVEIPIRLMLPGVTWLCAGRSERGLAEVFTPNCCTHLFPDGLTPMGAWDVRTMLLEKIGPLRRRLVANDRDVDDVVVNPFVERVTQCAQGLPLYVTYLIGDILAGRFRALDAGERLPPSLERYHEQLLMRCAVGIVHQVVTPLSATLAISHEPLSVATLVEALRESNLLPDGDEGPLVVKRALMALGSMVRRSKTPDGDEGYGLYHHSLRQHMEQSAETKVVLSTARKRLCEFVMRAGGSDSGLIPSYLLRQGINHLTEDSRWQDVATVLCNFSYLRKRTSLSEQSSYSLGLSLVANEPIIEEYRVTRSHLEAAAARELDACFWSVFMQVIALDRKRGVWLRTVLKRYRRDIPAEVIDVLVQDEECLATVLEMIASLYSGFGWQAELSAMEPVEFAVTFIDAAGRAGANEFLQSVLSAKLGPWGVLLNEEPGPDGNLTHTLWEQDMRYMYYTIQAAVDGAIAMIHYSTNR